jgi:uncharacterized membrane protein YqgA involved in biofilm formation
VTGTVINVAAILLGGILGLARVKPLSLRHQALSKVGIGVGIIVCGLGLTWHNLNGSFGSILKQIAIIILALVLGRVTGRILQLQKLSNRLGRSAREHIAAAGVPGPQRFSTGFIVCASLFCAAPLGILGAIEDGVSSYPVPLIVKALMDGLAAMTFVTMFGPGVLLSAVPVLVFQGTIALCSARYLQPILESHGVMGPFNATAGLLIFTVALLVFDVKKVEVTGYLPSLFFAPLLAMWWR